MEITHEVVAENHLKVVLKLEPQDYSAKVDEEIKSLRKKIAIDGFRPGKVPYGLAKKMYGDTVLADELNKMISESLSSYIKENDLKIFGEPLPVTVNQNKISVHRPEPYSFGFEIGLMPGFEMPSLETKTFEKKIIRITDKMIDEETDRIRIRFGEREQPEFIGEEDILVGTFQELSGENTLKEDGVTSTTSFALKNVKDEGSREKFAGLKKEGATELSIHTAFGSDEELIIHHLLKIDHQRAENMNDGFRFTLRNIIRIKKAELNQEIFDKAFGMGNVSSEEEMKLAIRDQMRNEFENYSNAKLDRDILGYLNTETKLELPSVFLRRLINLNQMDERAEMNDDEFMDAIRQIKQDLIFRQLVKDNNIIPEEEEVKSEARKDVLNYLGKNAVTFQDNPEALDEIAASLLKTEKNATEIKTRVLNLKLLTLLRTKVKFEIKEVDENEFFHH